jgi:CRP/FNR family transcriptional regulator, cyclic AMP receptor protein
MKDNLDHGTERTSATSKTVSTNNTELWVKNCPLFWDMSPGELAEVRRRLVSETYPKDEVILREGKTFQVLFVIAHGECEVFKTVKAGIEQRLTVLDPGSVFGEMSFYQPAPHSASVRAIMEVEVMRLSREEFASLQQCCPAVVHKMLVNSVRILAERLRRMDDWTCKLVEHPDGSESHRKEWRDFRSKLYTDWHF